MSTRSGRCREHARCGRREARRSARRSAELGASASGWGRHVGKTCGEDMWGRHGQTGCGLSRERASDVPSARIPQRREGECREPCGRDPNCGDAVWQAKCFGRACIFVRRLQIRSLHVRQRGFVHARMNVNVHDVVFDLCSCRQSFRRGARNRNQRAGREIKCFLFRLQQSWHESWPQPHSSTDSTASHDARRPRGLHFFLDTPACPVSVASSCVCLSAPSSGPEVVRLSPERERPQALPKRDSRFVAEGL